MRKKVLKLEEFPNLQKYLAACRHMEVWQLQMGVEYINAII
jgi:hypothetical protein